MVIGQNLRGKYNMKKLFKKLLALSLLSMVILSFTGCGAKPDAAVKGFLDTVKKQDFSAAAKYMSNENDKSEFEYDSKEQEQMIKAVFSKLDYEIISTSKNGNTATVKAKITSCDLPKISAKTIADLLPTMLASAFDEKKDEKKQEEMILQSFLNSINAPDAPKTVTEVDIKLVKDKNSWLIEGNDDLLNAMTGNFAKITDTLNK